MEGCYHGATKIGERSNFTLHYGRLIYHIGVFYLRTVSLGKNGNFIHVLAILSNLKLPLNVNHYSQIWITIKASHKL